MFGDFFKLSLVRLMIDSITKADLDLRSADTDDADQFSLLSLAGFVFVWLIFLMGRNVFLHRETGEAWIGNVKWNDELSILSPYIFIVLFSTVIGTTLYLIGVGQRYISESMELVAAILIVSGLVFLHNLIWPASILWMLEHFVKISDCIIAPFNSCDPQTESYDELSTNISHYMISLVYCLFGVLVVVLTTQRRDKIMSEVIGGFSATIRSTRGRRRCYFALALWLISAALFFVFIFSNIILTDTSTPSSDAGTTITVASIKNHAGYGHQKG